MKYLIRSIALLLLALFKSAAYEGYPGNLLTRGKYEGVAILTGATYDFPGDTNNGIVHCEGDSTLTVQADMTGAADADLAITVTPYEADNLTVSGVNLPAAKSQGPTFVGGRVTFYAEYDVSGIESCRIRVKNNNVGTQTLTRGSYHLS